MINIRNLRIDSASLGQKMLLVDIRPVYEYQNNQRTERVTGYRYDVALPTHSLDKLGVKIEGKQLIEKPADFAEVEFANMEITVFVSNGQPQVTAKATGIALVNKKP